ncbi:MAG: hypothetical protein L6R40_007036 [Gallowayella cf. fulva]|nr:MAG: hypothetical protein L6R40_007036 [Xanthomendoza cf. fulva]
MSSLATRRITSSLPLTTRLVRTPTPSPSATPTPPRAFSSTPSPQSGGDAHSHYDPPGGWLWGIPPGQKQEKESWEWMWTYGFFGVCGLGTVVGYAYKPDTSIQTWALEEARRQLEAEGILEDPSPVKK